MLDKHKVLHATCLLFYGLSCTSPTQATDPVADIRDVEADLVVPTLVDEIPAAGRRVRHRLPNYPRDIYHVLYLPTDWQPNREYPVIVEYAGNGPYESPFGDVSTGFVEGSNLGYGISAGREAIWVCLPYLNNVGSQSVQQWWGNPPIFQVEPTVEYCKKAVPWICKEFGGDAKRVLLVGFSRGAIACNYVGLHDDEIAKLWKAMIPYSHYDGVHPDWQYQAADRVSAIKRLRRLGNRPQLICHETTTSKLNLAETKSYIEETGIRIQATFLETGFRNHNDAWVLRPSPARNELRRWAQKQLAEAGRVAE